MTPVRIHNGTVTPLERQHLGGSGGARESFIQNLIHSHPSVIPMGEIEPAFNGMVSLCMELKLGSGYLDNLWITPLGGIILGECKLFRNPRARREVIAQALDYAQALQGMSYEDFERRIANARAEPNFKLWTFATDSALADIRTEEARDVASERKGEADFIDGVSRRLRQGRFLVLVIGDGIQEGLNDLTEYLQLHAGIHANLALIDLSIWNIPDGGVLVVPRLPLKTATIVRGIVETATREDPPRFAALSMNQNSYSVPQHAVAASEDEYFSELRANDATAANVSRVLSQALTDAGAEVRYSPHYMHFGSIPGTKKKSIFNIDTRGYISDGTILANQNDSDKNIQIRRLLDDLANQFGANIHYTPQGYHLFKTSDGKKPSITFISERIPRISDIVSKIVKLANDD